jgi:hypothetical protein
MPEDKAFFTSNNSCDRTELMDNLLRKAKGLKESLNKEAQIFGQQTLDLLGMLIDSVRKASTITALSAVMRTNENS